VARVEGSDPERTAGRVETGDARETRRRDEKTRREATVVRDVPAYVRKYSNLRRNRGEIGVGQQVTSQTKPSANVRRIPTKRANVKTRVASRHFQKSFSKKKSS